MSWLFSLLVLLIVQCYVIDKTTASTFFRKDYTFLAESQSFYKIHTIHRNWEDAKKRCEMEGASLFYPQDKTEVDAVIAFWTKTQPFAWVFIGVTDLLSKYDFETIDGAPINDVYNNWGPGEPNDSNGEDCVILRREGTLNDDHCENKYPFICKKRSDAVEWNIFCDLPDPHYLYNAELGKCYKFHLKPLNWTDAYSVCAAEQSYLAIINSQKEADYLVNVTAKAPKDNVTGNYMRGAIILGYHNRKQEGWKTIKGTTLEDAGYATWGNQQPDGGSKELCGTMFFNGRLNDLACDWKAFFICEHDVGLLSSAIDDRFSNGDPE